MVITELENLSDQVKVTPGIQKGIDFLRRSRGQNVPNGRVDIDGDSVYAIVQTYETRTGEPEKYEGHRKYIDLQFVDAGEEVIAWAYIGRVSITEQYNEKDDYWLGTVPADQATGTRLSPGQVAVLYPTDAHAPARAAGTSGTVKKIVVKVAVGA